MSTSTAIDVIGKNHKPPASMGAFLETIAPEVQKVLPKHIKIETLIRVVETFGAQDDRLMKCSQSSLLTSLMTCSQLGLTPNTPQGFAWLIPFWNGRAKRMECKIMFGYQGLAQLVRQSGEVLRMNSGLVYRHEVDRGLFKFTGEPPAIHHTQDLLADDKLYADSELIAAYAVIETKAGGRIQRVLRRSEVLKRRDSSQAVQRAKKDDKKTPWDYWEGPMWRKTALRALCGAAEAPKSTDIQLALENDIDSPDFDDPRHIIMTQADGFRQQAAAGAAPPRAAIDTTAEPVDDAPPPQEPPGAAPGADGATNQDDGAQQPTGPKMATKAQTGRLWTRWCTIMDVNTKAPTEKNKAAFVELVAQLIDQTRAGDSKTWTAEDYEAISAGLDRLRDGLPVVDPPPPSEATDAQEAPPSEATDAQEAPPSEAAGATNSPQSEQSADPEPEMSKADALSMLKELRKEFDMGWDDVRAIARELGVTAQSSAKWTVEQILGVAARMRGDGDGPPTEEPPAVDDGNEPDSEETVQDPDEPPTPDEDENS